MSDSIRVMRKLTLLAGLVMFALNAGAAEPTWHLSLQLYSLHEHTAAIDLTNNTPGAGIMYRTDDWFASVGVFRNSLARTAGYAYVGKQWPVGGVQLGGIAGLTHHYNFNHGGLVPLAAAVVSVPLAKRWALDLVGIPRISGYTYATLNFSVRWQFR